MKSVKENSVHRGKILERAFKESGLKVTELIERMKYSSRNSYYAHIRKPDLSWAILKQYGKVLHYDFSEDFPEMEKQQLNDGPAFYLNTPQDIEEATSQRNYYHRLYVELLEKVRKLEEEIAVLKKG